MSKLTLTFRFLNTPLSLLIPNVIWILFIHLFLKQCYYILLPTITNIINVSLSLSWRSAVATNACSVTSSPVKYLDGWLPCKTERCEPVSVRRCERLSVTDRPCSRYLADMDVNISINKCDDRPTIRQPYPTSKIQVDSSDVNKDLTEAKARTKDLTHKA